jgi:hypothetical protein
LSLRKSWRPIGVQQGFSMRFVFSGIAMVIASVVSASAAPPAPTGSASPAAPTPSTRPAVAFPTTRPAPLAGKGGLNARLADARLINITLAEAIDYLRDVSGANIHVNWKALEPLGITQDTVVDIRMRNVTVRRMLRALIDQIGAAGQVTSYVEDGIVEVTTREIADQQIIIKVYPVGDLVMSVPDFAGPAMDLSRQQNTASGAGGGGSASSGSLFESDTTASNNPDAQKSRAERANDLVKLITETVRPEIWRENGGPASIRYFNGHLIVAAPRSVQEAIGGR